MASFAHSKLTVLQDEVLRAFFERERGCFLTGGAALAWLLSEIAIPDGVVLPAGVLPGELRAYVTALVARLLVLAAPR